METKMISPREVRSRMEADPTLLVIDVRTPAEYARVHVTGATLMPFDELDPAIVKARRHGAADVFVICHSGGRSAKAQEILTSAGIEKVYCVAGGTEAWNREGLPVTRLGGKVISLERQVRIGAGSIVLIATILALTVNIWFIGLAMFVGAGLVFAGITDFCGMGLILARMPWNRRGGSGCNAEAKAAAKIA